MATTKEIDDAVGVYTMSIQYPNHTVDILDEYYKVVFRKVPKHKAEQICDLHNTFRRKVHSILIDF